MIPDGYSADQFLLPALPEDPFFIRLDGDDDNTDGPFMPDQFQTMDDDTNIMYAHNDGGSPVIIRCVMQFGNSLDVVDGTGAVHRWDLQPVPDNVLEAETPVNPYQPNVVPGESA